MCSLLTSCQIHVHPRLTLLWSLQTTFLKTTLMWILNWLNSRPGCGLNRRMCLEQYFMATIAYHSHLNTEFYVKHPNIRVCRCTEEGSTNSVTMLPWTVYRSQHYIQAWTRDSLMLLHNVHNYYDHWTHVLIRQQYLRQDAALSQGRLRCTFRSLGSRQSIEV